MTGNTIELEIHHNAIYSGRIGFKFVEAVFELDKHVDHQRSADPDRQAEHKDDWKRYIAGERPEGYE